MSDDLGRAGPGRFVVRPRRWTQVLFVVGCLAFVAAGVAMVVLGDGTAPLWGAVSVLFFGGGGAVALPRLLRPSVVLTMQGIELSPRGLVPWEDIEDVGVVRLPRGAKVVGIRLSRTDRYLASRLGERRGWRAALARAAHVPYGGYHVMLSPAQLDRPLKQFPGFLWE